MKKLKIEVFYVKKFDDNLQKIEVCKELNLGWCKNVMKKLDRLKFFMKKKTVNNRTTTWINTIIELFREKIEVCKELHVWWWKKFHEKNGDGTFLWKR